jgi:UDP-glucose 4-epimerase
MRDGSRPEKDFSKYDVVFHVSGIAHVSQNKNMEDLYYKINRDLAIKTAEKAKKAGVKQFIFMSSIIIYGDSSCNKKVITKETIPNPSNSYGNSKLQAEQGIKPLNDHKFKVVIIRSPMVYGKGSKGNYPILSKVAQKLPIFPDIDNERSLIHIDNLCEFIKLMIDNEEDGIYFPQNEEYIKISEMVRLIAETHGKKIWMTKAFNPIIKAICPTLKIISKVFGNLVYEKSMSHYKQDYRIRDFYESIKLTENN